MGAKCTANYAGNAPLLVQMWDTVKPLFQGLVDSKEQRIPYRGMGGAVFFILFIVPSRRQKSRF
jgi:hypothetical protein